MIIFFTDFGAEGPYLAQMEAAVLREAPNSRVVNLLSNAPVADPVAASYLLAALCKSFDAGSIFVAVVDPGVGGDRAAVVLKADERYFVGPDNGLLNTVAKQAESCQWFEIDWRPEHCSFSFHGRDVFAPIAAKLSVGRADACLRAIDKNLDEWPADRYKLIYFDHYGNAMTGIRYRPEHRGGVLQIFHQQFLQADTFCRVEPQQCFWYCNSSGLIEVAVNQARARDLLELALGDPVSLDHE